MFFFRSGSDGASFDLAGFKFLNFGVSGSAPAEPGGTDEPNAPDSPARLYELSGSRFVSEKYGFSFDLPEGFKAGTFPDEKGELVVIEKSPSEGFQIYISPFDTEGPLTADFIRSELPNMPMRNVKTAKLDLVPAVVFGSANESIGETFEVWLAYPESPVAHGNYLYQIMTYREFAGEMTGILQSWTFSK